MPVRIHTVLFTHELYSGNTSTRVMIDVPIGQSINPEIMELLLAAFLICIFVLLLELKNN